MVGSLILCVIRDLRFDNVPFGRTQFAPTLWTKSVTVGAHVSFVSGVVLSTHSLANLLKSGAADFLSQFEEGLKTGAMWTPIERLS